MATIPDPTLPLGASNEIYDNSTTEPETWKRRRAIF